MQGLSRALTDALVKHDAKQLKAADKVPPGYSSVGLDTVAPVQLQSRTLERALGNLETPEDWQYFGKHALPICLTTFVNSCRGAYTQGLGWF